MCGIAGWYGGDARIEADALLPGLRHRGPDGEGAWVHGDSSAGLVHTRLAIIDPTDAAAQPMAWQDRHRITFNGEIYNYHELRTELEAAGEKFTTHSDTEVLLRLLALEGWRALPKVAGMFAFAYHDSATGRGLLARDALGIKPLYYTLKGRGVAFASEVKVLHHACPGLATSPTALRDHFLWGSIPEPRTIVEGIAQVPAGSCVEWDGESARIQAWHELRFTPTDMSAAGAVEVARAALLESARRHLVSDVPVGLFLSGGVDSTAILALTRGILGPAADLRTFSIGFDDPAYDESEMARRSARHFGTRHTEWRMTAAEGRHEVSGYLRAMDQPTIDGFNTWCVSKLANRSGIKVVLSGLGGDEIFGGYPSFTQVPRLLRLHRVAGPLRGAVAAALSLAAAGSRWRRLAAFMNGPGTPLAAFHAQRGIFTEAESNRLAGALAGAVPDPLDWSIPDLPADELDAISYLEISRYMRNQLLRDSDVFAMAHGVELRVPFVDARLLGSLAAIPSRIRLRPGKALLLEAVPEIPEWVRGQPKRGFRFPFEEWMRGSFADLLDGAELRSSTELGTWYRRWAMASALQRM
jgi:asparagine synthase (glutamine-hydrolysing)